LDNRLQRTSQAKDPSRSITPSTVISNGHNSGLPEIGGSVIRIESFGLSSRAFFHFNFPLKTPSLPTSKP
jgi:hypothetical protein